MAVKRTSASNVFFIVLLVVSIVVGGLLLYVQWASPNMSWSERVSHWGAALRSYNSVGALLPSSTFLGDVIVEKVDWTRRNAVIVEVGAGTGVFTRLIVQKMAPDARLVVVELDKQLAENLRAEFAADRRVCIVHGSVENLAQHLQACTGRVEADFVVSALPWTAMDDDTQKKLLNGILKGLQRRRMPKPRVFFSTFMYTSSTWKPSAHKFLQLLEHNFSGGVEKSKTVWRNVPPAFVYHCAL